MDETLYKIYPNTGLLGIIFSRIRAESKIQSICGKLSVRGNPHPGILYAVKLLEI